MRAAHEQAFDSACSKTSLHIFEVGMPQCTAIRKFPAPVLAQQNAELQMQANQQMQVNQMQQRSCNVRQEETRVTPIGARR